MTTTKPVAPKTYATIEDLVNREARLDVEVSFNNQEPVFIQLTYVPNIITQRWLMEMERAERRMDEELSKLEGAELDAAQERVLTETSSRTSELITKCSLFGDKDPAEYDWSVVPIMIQQALLNECMDHASRGPKAKSS